MSSSSMSQNIECYYNVGPTAFPVISESIGMSEPTQGLSAPACNVSKSNEVISSTSTAGPNSYANELTVRLNDGTIKTTKVQFSYPKGFEHSRTNIGEQKQMTSYVVAKNKNGVVLAIDSREQIINGQGIVKYNDNFTKIVHLEKVGFVVLNAGNNRFAGMEFSVWVEQINGLKNKSAKEALRIIAKAAIKDAPSKKETFVITDTSNLQTFSIEIKGTEDFVIENNIIELSGCNFAWSNPLGVDMVQTIYDESLFTKLEKEDKTIIYAVDIGIMSLPTLCDFARHIVQTHIDICKFHEYAYPVVGGDIHIFSISANKEVKEYTMPSQYTF